LIQKEEERARKKIQETKERAAEILNLRTENEKRIQAYVNAAGEIKQLQQVLIAKNREQDTEGKKARQQRLQSLHHRRKEEVNEMLMEKKYLSQLMIQEQTRDILVKQKKREEIRKMEEEIRIKKEQERREKERKIKEMYERKVLEEALEAKRAEKLVKALEKKEKEWIDKLRSTQYTQDTAFEQLEQALHGEEELLGSSSARSATYRSPKTNRNTTGTGTGTATNGTVSAGQMGMNNPNGGIRTPSFSPPSSSPAVLMTNTNNLKEFSISQQSAFSPSPLRGTSASVSVSSSNSQGNGNGQGKGELVRTNSVNSTGFGLEDGDMNTFVSSITSAQNNTINNNNNNNGNSNGHRGRGNTNSNTNKPPRQRSAQRSRR